MDDLGVPLFLETPIFCVGKTLSFLQICDKKSHKSYKNKNKWNPGEMNQFDNPKNQLGPSYRGVWMSIAGVWDLQTTSFEIP